MRGHFSKRFSRMRLPQPSRPPSLQPALTLQLHHLPVAPGLEEGAGSLTPHAARAVHEDLRERGREGVVDVDS